MSDEPVYCTFCGAEDFDCDCREGAEGPYCNVCGVIPDIGKECNFYKDGGLESGCESSS